MLDFKKKLKDMAAAGDTEAAEYAADTEDLPEPDYSNGPDMDAMMEDEGADEVPVIPVDDCTSVVQGVLDAANVTTPGLAQKVCDALQAKGMLAHEDETTAGVPAPRTGMDSDFG